MTADGLGLIVGFDEQHLPAQPFRDARTVKAVLGRDAIINCIVARTAIFIVASSPSLSLIRMINSSARSVCTNPARHPGVHPLVSSGCHRKAGDMASSTSRRCFSSRALWVLVWTGVREATQAAQSSVHMYDFNYLCGSRRRREDGVSGRTLDGATGLDPWDRVRGQQLSTGLSADPASRAPGCMAMNVKPSDLRL